jgi:hypothetical protein
MFDVGSMVQCTRFFMMEEEYPNIRFPKIGEYYWIRDVIFYHNSHTVGLTFYEIKNGLHESLGGGFPEEPSFNSENFTLILKPLPKIDVDRIIRQCMKK